ncbi:MAG: hypothetical protein IT385_25845 [Deltaproteobacteria bacterium]|nr:hypothetical protein [Deltaproteobacteria bacterium]
MIVALAALITGVMGVRAPRGRAVSFVDIALQGMGRATLRVEETAPLPPEVMSQTNEVFARLIYASELSTFGRGLYIRSSFTLPATQETAVLVVDVDRARGQKQWSWDSDGLRARFYTLEEPDAKAPRFDGTPVEGSLELEASVVGSSRAGFRITGWLALEDAGSDGVRGNDDDGAFHVELELESVPPPEEIAGQPARPVPEPTGGVCDPYWCWRDDGYYDGYWYGPGCGDAEVGYETTDSGCDADTVDDDPIIDGDPGVYDPYAPDPYDEDAGGGCDGETTDDGDSSTSGCEGSDDPSTTSESGCDSGDDSSSSSSSGCDDSSSSSSGSGCDDSSSSSGSGCDDSSSSSSCGGGGGCEGDTLQRAPAATGRVMDGSVGWIAVGMFFGAIGMAARRRDDD